MQRDTSLGVALSTVKFPPPTPLPQSPSASPLQPVDKKSKKSAKAARSETTSAVCVNAEVSLKLLTDIDPAKFNLLAFGLPNVTLGEVVVTKGKK